MASQAQTKNQSNVISYTTYALLAGFGLLVISLFLDLSADLANFLSTHHDLRMIARALELLAAHLGVAVIVFGMVGWGLERKEISDYFLKRLAQTVVTRDFLSKLGEDELREVQRDTVRAYIGRTRAGEKEGELDEGFHRRFDELFESLGKPYRENTTDKMSIKHARGPQDPNTGYFEVTDQLSYTCRKVGNSISHDVRWLPDVEEVESLQVTVHIPDEIFTSPSFKSEHAAFLERVGNKNQWTKDLKNDAKAFKTEENGCIVFDLDAIDNEIKSIDRLFVMVNVCFRCPANRGLPWTMSLPSKGVTIFVHYPHDLTLSVTNFGVRQEAMLPDGPREEGVYNFNFPSWLLPDTGFFFLFLKKHNIAAGHVGATHPQQETP